MQKKEFFREAEEKANAMKYFRDFFEMDLSISNDKTFGELRKEYLNYCEEYFTRFGQDNEIDKLNIKMAYNYMKNILKQRQKTYQNKSDITKQVLDGYEILLEAITGYSFITQGPNTCGGKQNRTNKQIVFEISSLKPMLIMVLENIDAHFEKIIDVTKISYFDIQLMERLKELTQELSESIENLLDARDDYYDIRNLTINSKYYSGDAKFFGLGKAKKEWKTAKNNACCTILNFYREMKDINMSLPTEEMVHTIEETNTLFECGMKNIVSGPNYYCYLSEEERKSIIEENMARKRKLKEIQN